MDYKEYHAILKIINFLLEGGPNLGMEFLVPNNIKLFELVIKNGEKQEKLVREDLDYIDKFYNWIKEDNNDNPEVLKHIEDLMKKRD